MLNRFKKFELLSDYIDEKLNEIEKDNKNKDIDSTELINGRRLTNVGTFRAYLKLYLKKNQHLVRMMSKFGLIMLSYLTKNVNVWHVPLVIF